MAKAKKFKLYTHDRRFLSLGTKSSNTFVSFLIKIANMVYGFFYAVGTAVVKFMKAWASFFYFIGNGLIKAALRFLSAAKNDFTQTAKVLPRRFRQLQNLDFAKSLAVFFAVALIGWGAIGVFKFIESGLGLKDEVVSSAQYGGQYLVQAAADIKNHDLTSAQNKLALALKFFGQGQSELAGQGTALGQMVKALPQGRDADRLLQAAGLIARAGQNMVDFEILAGQLHISASGIVSQNQNNGEVFAGLNDSFNRVGVNLNQAADLIGLVNPDTLPANYRGSFTLLQSNLGIFKQALSGARQIFSVAQSLIAGNKNILILFENNNELRASGGFMGTFGSLQARDGQIQKINVSSIYDLDGQLKDIIQPPLPIVAVTPKWSLRDSNWFADFPTSAKKISQFYQKEGGQQPDVIIAMTPNLIVDWLKISGPVYMPKYGVTLSADNFVEETQAITTISDNMPTNSPKQMLADFVPVLLQKISSMDKNAQSGILAALQQNLSSKQIAVYAKEPGLEKQIQNFNWGGNLLDTDSDYLMTQDSNLGATKTNLDIGQSMKLTSTIQSDGTITDQLQITRTNNNPPNPDNSNASYFRVYVPSGSKLLSSSGFNKKDLQYPDNLNYQIDPDVYNLEKTSVTDNLTGTIIGQESGKTYFGNWIILNPGESTTTTLVYQLPFKLGDLDHYSLLVQKQMGSLNNNFTWTVNFQGRRVLWKNFDVKKQATDSLDSGIIIDKDYLLGLVLQK
jgi:hypothetical protein